MTDSNLPLHEHDGRSLTVVEWAITTGIRSYDISMRLRQGWTIARIIADVRPVNEPAELPERQAVPHVASEIEVDDYKPRRRKRRQPHIATTIPQAANVQRLAHAGEYLTIKEWGAKLGLNTSTISTRLWKGWTIEAALSPKRAPKEAAIKPSNDARRYSFDGQSLTVREWSEQTGLRVGLISSRLAKGWSLERTLTEEPGTVLALRQNTIAHNGVTLTEASWARRLGISRAALKYRLTQGWPLDKALSPELIIRRHVAFTYGGKTMTIREWAGETGIKYQTIISRMHQGWTFERAITVEPGTTRIGAHAARRASIAATQPEGAMSPSQGGGSATFDPHRGPAGDGSRESAPKQAFS